MRVKCGADERFLAAKKYCFKLLGVRARTKAELISRLEEKKYASRIIKKAVQGFVDAKLVDDKKFAHDFIEQRLASNYGKRRILFELKQKNIPEAIVNQELLSALSGYDEMQAATQEAEKYINAYRNLSPEIIQRRLYGYLIRKGFSEDIVQNIANHYDNERNP